MSEMSVAFPKSLENPLTLGVTPNLADSWRVESLIGVAFKRTKERFLSYFLALVLSFLVCGAIFLVVGLTALILGVVFAVTKSILLLVILALPLGLLAFFASFYVGVLVQLTLVEVLIQKERIGVMETFGRMRPYVWGYYFYSLFSAIFLFGLLPLGFLSLGIVLFLWSFWNSFGLFVYLEKRKKYLANLWYSRTLINQRFWGIIGRLVLIYAAYYFVIILLFSTQSSLIIGLAGIISWFVGLFITSYTYEMYTLLPEPQTEPKRPTVWIFLSVLGWIVMIVLLILAILAAPKALQNVPWDKLQDSFRRSLKEGKAPSLTNLPKTSSQALTKALIVSANAKLLTANQIATKADLSQSEKDQIVALDQGAIVDLKQATQNDPASADAWYTLGSTYWSLGNVVDGAYDWAIDSFKKAAALKPEDSRNYYYLGITYKKVGDLVKARESLTRALELSPASDPDRAKVEIELQDL